MHIPNDSYVSHHDETASPVKEPDSREAENAREPRVAVIAIHGVGRHAPGASAEAVATLLLSIRNGINAAARDSGKTNAAGNFNGRPLYSGCVTSAIDVPLRPVNSPSRDADRANDRDQQSWFSRLWGLFDERRGFLSQARKEKGHYPRGYDKRELRKGEPDRGDFAYRFMITQLAGYQGEVDRDFQTVRLETTRDSPPGPTVHIYDAHYSDLSKPQSNIVAFFFTFYQLLFHLASLSLLAVYWTEAENVMTQSAQRWRWRVVSSIHATSVRLLTMFVPILNVILLEIACSAFIDKALHQSWLPFVSLCFASFLGMAAAFLVLRNLGSPSRPFLWALLPFLGAAGGLVILGGLACLYNSIYRLNIDFYQTLLLLSWLSIAGVVLGWIAWTFNQLRPGAFWLAVVLYVGNCSLFLLRLLPRACLLQFTGTNQFAAASLWSVQWTFGELLLSWIICLLCALITWPLSIFCTRTIKAQADESGANAAGRKARAIAAFRTGRFAFSIPAILFVIVTCVLWSGVVSYGLAKLHAYDGLTQAVASAGPASQPQLSHLTPGVCAVDRWMGRIDPKYEAPECDPAASLGQTPFRSNYLTGLLLVSITPSLPITMIIFVLCLFLLIWAVLPSVVFEINPEWTEGNPTNRIRALGEWLSRGLDNTAILTRALWFAIVPVPLIFFVVDWMVLHDFLLPTNGALTYINSAVKVTLLLIEGQGLALVVFGAALAGFILKYLTTVLDAILDVDNYLRTSPLEETPRAKIAERITSLLRYIARQSDDHGRPYYTKLIIVAHSLGSMVTADLLRYLERSGREARDPDLGRYGFREPSDKKRDIPICVFSMGSPLRQLLNRFFPHLYWWVSDIPDNSVTDLGDPVVNIMPQINAPLPRTDEMNVTHWSNAYRSGDYIGRSLWVGEWLQRNLSGDLQQPPDSANAPAPQACDEMCIGLGAHTHYWDRSALEIAWRLDELIAR
jgi:hypothetical protein